MLQTALVILPIILLSVLLLSIRLLCGKKDFVNSHIDGNKALNSQGIFCAKQQDRNQRKNSGFRIKEHIK
ncbi:MAG TPA: hypothetical protein DEQ84_06880 [Prevotellaceae bacterium]|nr:hypothetical protein [Prevotellaceae bacterium]